MTRFLKRLWRQRALLYFIIVPVLLLPITLVDPQPKWLCAYVVALMACYWLPQVLPIAVTALLPLILFPVFGILSSKETAKMYMSDPTLIITGGMFLAVAIEVWDLHKRIALRILLCVGSEPRWLMFGLMISTWFLSMWISNTATTAMMIPITQAILTQLQQEESPDCEETCQAGPEETVLTRLRNRRTNSHRHRRVCKGMTLSIAYAANIGGIATLTGTPTNVVLKGQADMLFAQYGVTSTLSYGLWMVTSLPLSLLLLLLAWGCLQVFFLPRICRKDRLSHSDDEPSKDAVAAAIRRQYESLGPVTFPQYSVLMLFTLLVVLWITRDMGGAGGWGLLFPGRFVSDATTAIAVSMLLFILPSNNPFKPLTTDTTQTTLLTWNQFISRMPWAIVLLLGGGFSLAKGCAVSGLSEWVGERLESLSHLNPTITLFVVCYAMTAATEITNNVAIATLLLPALAQLALVTKVNPLYFMFPATVTASLAFLLPGATPPNAIVFASGYVKIIDMVLAGLALNILSVPLVVMATETWGTALFSLDVFPESFGNMTFRNNTSVTA